MRIFSRHGQIKSSCHEANENGVKATTKDKERQSISATISFRGRGLTEAEVGTEVIKRWNITRYAKLTAETLTCQLFDLTVLPTLPVGQRPVYGQWGSELG